MYPINLSFLSLVDIMKTAEEYQLTSTFDDSTKIKCLIEMALKKEIPWSTVHSTVEKLTFTLEKSKQVNKLLLYELEKLHSKSQDQENESESVDLGSDNFQEEYQLLDNSEPNEIEDYLENDIQGEQNQKSRFHLLITFSLVDLEY